MSRWFSFVYGAPDGDCDNVISALKWVTNLVTCNKLGVEMKDFLGIRKSILAEALATFTSVDDA